MCLILCGLFALFLSATGHFLPHDVQFLGMEAKELCAINECRIVHFMFHDRVSFGGAIIAIGLLYLWLVEFPLKDGEAWAWWLFVVSGLIGFSSFLAYLGYGYLDSWHGIATLGLLPCYVIGLIRARSCLSQSKGSRSLFESGTDLPWSSRQGIGRALLLATGAGLTAAGSTILIIGMTCVFVPQDLAFMGFSAEDLHSINPRLVPLIAHDRAGFGGGVCTFGVLMFFCVWRGQPSQSLWQALLLSGLVAFTTAIGVHPIIGYTDVTHLAPAVTGAVLFVCGIVLARSSGGVFQVHR